MCKRRTFFQIYVVRLQILPKSGLKMQQGGEQEVLQGVKKTILVLSGMSSSLGTHPTVLEIRLHDTVPK